MLLTPHELKQISKRLTLKYSLKTGRHLEDLLGIKDITYIRRAGNTTRQIDHAIQLLFSGTIVHCTDHHEEGGSREMNRRLLELILNRLINEHNLRRDQIVIDKPDAIIYLKEPLY